MRHTARFMMSVSVIALMALSAAPSVAQTSPLRAEQIRTDPLARTRAETALLYATTLDRLTRIIERDIAADPGVSVITGLRQGRLDTLPSLDPELRALISALRIGARVMDTDPDPTRMDERAIVFVADVDLRNGVTRADIEAAAREARLGSIARLQERQILGPDGAFEVPRGMTGLPGAAVATYVGVRGADLVTSSGAGSGEMRTLPCPAGEFGTGIVQYRDLSRTTTLSGGVSGSAGAWTETSRSCAPEYSETIRVFDACVTASGGAGTAVFEVTQHVRRDPGDPFGTVIEIEESGRVQVSGGTCVEMSRLGASQDFLVEGGLTARRELELRTATASSDIGSGVNRVPRVVDGEPGAGGPVPSIPFAARSVSDFEFLRSCAQEYGPLGMPSTGLNPSGTGTGPWSGPTTFTGEVTWHRDYNRRETTFTDDPLAYILNYDLVLDPNPFGWGPKGRQTVPTTFGPGPDGDGWYRSVQICERDLTRAETQTATRSCSAGYPAFPLGTYEERRDGTGTYEQGLLVTGSVQNPTHLSTAWGDWYEISNGCYHRTVTRTDETRVISTSSGSQTCDQPQRRTRVDTTDTFQRGGSTTRVTYDPNWTNDGAPTNCVTNFSGGGGDSGGTGYRGNDGNWYDSERDANNLGGGHSGHTISGHQQCGSSCGGSSNSSGSSGGDGGSCFVAGTRIMLENGVEKRIEDVRPGDILSGGGRVYMIGMFRSSDIWLLKGVQVTGDHIAKDENRWLLVRDHPEAHRIACLERDVYNLATTSNVIIAGGLVFADYTEISGTLVEDIMNAPETRSDQLLKAGEAA